MNECTRVAWFTNAHFNRYMHKWWYFNTNYNICIHKYVSIWTKFCTLTQFLTLQTLIEKHLFQCSDAHLRIFQIVYTLINCTGLCSLVVVCMRVVKCCKLRKWSLKIQMNRTRLTRTRSSINARVHVNSLWSANAWIPFCMSNLWYINADHYIFIRKHVFICINRCTII